ncbi:peptide/nickel transport system permease protein [Stackebrandtia albiflava]|uniref:Peptide/nickel transport system permease protein n=1 Tax=Stackebrandtia albiflava TaxID=406432 RepID=A0A562V4M9_9ACTN|nr:ABC transporter permease [Stackebrandtia albiflava]TWJ12795.1 peptide/nickel transport system permease protein [Stackebrandtia albiflava]
MLAYIIRRLLVAIPILLLASLFTFVMVEYSSDPIPTYRQQLEQNATASGMDAEAIDAAVERFKERNYYDRSTPERYWLWLTGIGGDGDIGLLQGEFGPSLRANYDIKGQLGDRFFITLRLVMMAVICSMGLAILAGVVMAVKQYRKIDYILTFIGFIALSMPVFWFAGLVKNMAVSYNKATDTETFATYGENAAGGTGNMTTFEALLDSASHLILPSLVLMLAGYASASRFQRAAMLDVLNSDYVRLARAKGLRNRTVMRKHALRTALIPMATLAPVAVLGAMAGAVVTETVFEWQGMGRFFVDALGQRDPFAIQAFLIISGVLTIIGVLISDLLYGIVDPRIRYE